MKPDQYETLARPVEGILFKERKSKFIGFAYPIKNEEEAELLLNQLKGEYPKANHICYAWQIGTEGNRWRANDDGEPNNSAGMPIYGQIQASGLSDLLVAVVRYFGGTKLGVGGLISAYRETARLTLEAGKTKTKVLYSEKVVEFEYGVLHRVMRLIKKHHIEILWEQNESQARYKLGIPEKFLETALKQFRDIQGLSIVENS